MMMPQERVRQIYPNHLRHAAHDRREDSAVSEKRSGLSQ